jgi:hypothetical protein
MLILRSEPLQLGAVCASDCGAAEAAIPRPARTAMTLRSRNDEGDVRDIPLDTMAFHSPIFSGQSV